MLDISPLQQSVCQGNFIAKVNGEFLHATNGKVGALNYQILAKEDNDFKAFAVRLTNQTDAPVVIGDIQLFCCAEQEPPTHERLIFHFTDSWRDNAVLKATDDKGPFTTTPMFLITDNQGENTLVAQFTFQHNKVLFQSTFDKDGKLAELKCTLPSYDCPIAPGASIETDYIAFYHSTPPTPSDALFAWAKAVGIENHIPKPCSTFAGLTGGSFLPVTNLTRAQIIDGQLKNIGNLHKLGCNYFWISITNLLGNRPGNWCYPNPVAYPDGLQNTLDKIKAAGLIPGFWFGVFYITEDSKDFQKVKPFLIRKKDGSLSERKVWRWCTPREDGSLPTLYALDPGKPESAEYVAGVLKTYAEWGIKYYMIDFLNAGLYQPDDQPTGYAYEAYIRFMRRLKTFVSPDTHLLSAVGSSCLLMGACDSCRIGPDYCETRSNLPQFPTYPACYGIGGSINSAGGSHRTAINSLAMWAFADKFFFKSNSNMFNSTKPIPLSEVKTTTTLFGISASPIMFGNNLQFIDEDRKNYMKLVLPRCNTSAVPVNLFTKTDMWDDFVSIFKLQVDKPWGTYYVVAVFNMNDSFRSVKLTPTQLNLPLGRQYCYYDFWDEKYMGTTDGDFTAEVPSQTASVIRIEERREHPWLLSTDLTIRQGEAEIPELHWEESTMTLSGKVTRAAGEKGNLFFLMKDGYAPVSNHGLVIVRYIRDWDMVIKMPVTFTHDTEEFAIQFKESEKTKDRKDVFLWR